MKHVQWPVLAIVLLLSCNPLLAQQGQVLTTPTLQTGITKAMNMAGYNDAGVWLSNSHFKVQFSPQGVCMSPKRNELTWKWSLTSFNGQQSSSVCPELKETKAQSYVDYDRDGVVERYLFKRSSIEQVFIVEQRPEGDLYINGKIESAGVLTETGHKHQWSNETGAVTLGQLYVYDAFGTPIHAHYEVCADFTSIQIEEADLVNAIFPITIDPEIGTNDFRISDVGGTGSNSTTASNPAVAYNSIDNEYLVVWQANDTDATGVVSGESEIFGQRLSNIGVEVGTNDFRISDVGGDGAGGTDASRPSVAYNLTDNEYLVVWQADDTDATGVVSGELEIFGQRLSNTGVEVGTNDFRISDAGGDGDGSIDAFDPEVAYNSTDNEYLVVWQADDTDATGVVDNEDEIFGQRLSNTGVEVGTNDFRISDAGGDGNSSIRALNLAVAYNSTDNEYLVVWQADDTDATGVVDNEDEIFGQRLSNTGLEIGANDFRISDAGGDAANDATHPSIAYNSTDNEYLVVWRADDTDVTGIINFENEIFGQRLSNTGVQVGTNDFRISDVTGDGNALYNAFSPSLAYNSTDNEYLVVWRANDTDATGISDNEFEIFGQGLSSTGVEIGTNDFRISDAGGTGISTIAAFVSLLTYNSTDNEYLVVWQADDTDATGVVDNEFEIFGQRIGGSALPVELLFFNARKSGQGAALSWQTATELDNEGFEIQHSTDGRTWESIDFVPGAGTTVSPQSYTFFHRDLAFGANYYRLKQWDFDGAFEYSSVEVVTHDVANLDWRIYPNPTTGSVSAVIQNPSQQPMTVYVSDYLGRLIWESGTIEDEIAWQRDFQLSQPGVYIMMVQIGEQWMQKKIVVVEGR